MEWMFRKRLFDLSLHPQLWARPAKEQFHVQVFPCLYRAFDQAGEQPRGRAFLTRLGRSLTTSPTPDSGRSKVGIARVHSTLMPLFDPKAQGREDHHLRNKLCK